MVPLFCTYVCVVLCIVTAKGRKPEVNCSPDPDINVTFVPNALRMMERTNDRLDLIIDPSLHVFADVEVTSSDPGIIGASLQKTFAAVTSRRSNVTAQVDDVDGVTNVSVRISARRLGKADVIYDIYTYVNTSSTAGVTSPSRVHLCIRYPVVVVRKTGVQDRIYHVIIQILLGLLNFAFGCELDMAIIWSYVRRPLAPSIGFCSQFLLMPLLGMAISQILRMDQAFSIGLISLSCAPGGGASNSWTILLGGDVNLSLTMTFMSLVLALGMMPLWMYIMSRLYIHTSAIRIPYIQILITLVLFVGPCFLGILFRRLKPQWAKGFSAIIKPTSVVFLLWILTFGTYVNLYMFKMMGTEPVIVLAGIMLPWFGFAFGFGLALATRQGREKSIAIAIETGIQNFGVPIVLLQRNFPQPEGDLGATMVNSVGIFTPVPLFVALMALTIRRRCNPKEKEKRLVADIQFAADPERLETSEVFISSGDATSRQASRKEVQLIRETPAEGSQEENPSEDERKSVFM